MIVFLLLTSLWAAAWVVYLAHKTETLEKRIEALEPGERTG